MLERLLIAAALIVLGLAAYRLFAQWHRAPHAAVSQHSTPATTPAILYFRSDQCAPCTTQALPWSNWQHNMGREAIPEIGADPRAGCGGALPASSRFRPRWCSTRPGQVPARTAAWPTRKLTAQVQPLVGG